MTSLGPSLLGSDRDPVLGQTFVRLLNLLPDLLYTSVYHSVLESCYKSVQPEPSTLDTGGLHLPLPTRGCLHLRILLGWFS